MGFKPMAPVYQSSAIFSKVQVTLNLFLAYINPNIVKVHKTGFYHGHNLHCSNNEEWSQLACDIIKRLTMLFF